MLSTQPVFMVGSGRSGTKMVSRLLHGCDQVEPHHEYLNTLIQPLAVQRYMGIISREQAVSGLRDAYSGAFYYSPAPIFLDCSHKLSFIIDDLADAYPGARFLHVTRDGRKVVASFLHKLQDECYDGPSIDVLMGWLADRSLPKPPAEKRYWWNVPQPGQPFAAEFPGLSRFQRICYHWREANRCILESFDKLPGRTLTLKLEDLKGDGPALRLLLDFFGVPFEKSLAEFLDKPQHVLVPFDFILEPEELEQFNAIAGYMMQLLGYTEAETYKTAY